MHKTRPRRRTVRPKTRPGGPAPARLQPGMPITQIVLATRGFRDSIGSTGNITIADI